MLQRNLATITYKGRWFAWMFGNKWWQLYKHTSSALETVINKGTVTSNNFKFQGVFILRVLSTSYDLLSSTLVQSS